MNNAQKVQSRLEWRLDKLKNECVIQVDLLGALNEIGQLDDHAFENISVELLTNHAELSSLKVLVMHSRNEVLSDELLTRILDVGVMHEKVMQKAHQIKQMCATHSLDLRVKEKIEERKHVVAVH